MVERIRYKNMAGVNLCRVYDCEGLTQEKGAYCELHWNLIPGAIRDQIEKALKLGDLAVHAREKMP